MNPYIHFPMVLGKVSCLPDLFKNRFGKEAKQRKTQNLNVFNPCLENTIYLSAFNKCFHSLWRA